MNCFLNRDNMHNTRLQHKISRQTGKRMSMHLSRLNIHNTGWRQQIRLRGQHRHRFGLLSQTQSRAAALPGLQHRQSQGTRHRLLLNSGQYTATNQVRTAQRELSRQVLFRTHMPAEEILPRIFCLLSGKISFFSIVYSYSIIIIYRE